jgi:RNA 3'-terminal phosphate cyclase (ATP)
LAEELIHLDGGAGEGGGQIVRTAISLSLITQRPFQISRIRANRKPDGLRPQHLACVRGAEAISAAASEGAAVGAKELTFIPGPVRTGEYLLEVGTAGATPLLLQCLLYPLALAGGSQLTLRGGTHLPHAPAFHYLSWVWLPMLRRFGFQAQVQLRYAGFYPEGGGEWRAVIEPARDPGEPVSLVSRGNLHEMDVASFVAGVPFEIAERQSKAALGKLRELGIRPTAENLPLPTMRSQGTVVLIRAAFEHTVAGFTALGARGKRAEEVGQEAAALVAQFMEGAGAVDEHLGDQLLLPAALLAAGRMGPARETRYTVATVTEHLTTCAAVIREFLPVRIEVSPGGEVVVSP